MSAPLIVTLALGRAAQSYFDRLRGQHYPPERNNLRAHVTLFHALPGIELPAISDHLAHAARRPAFDVDVAGVRMLGAGVAFTMKSNALSALRGDLAVSWHTWLTGQDRQAFAPHVTVQNKVDPAAARALHTDLAQAFIPFVVRADGLHLWHYRGGPWQRAMSHSFASAP